MKRILEVRNSRTYNLGNYENEKPEIAITYELDEWEDVNQVANKLKKYIDAKLDERDPKPRPFEFETEAPV